MRSLIKEIDQLLTGLKGKRLYLFLDYDGTLAPIARTPAKAKLSEEMRRTLRNISQNPLIKPVIVTGRSLPDIKNKVKLPSLTYAGNHGLEMDKSGIYVNFAREYDYKDAIKGLERELRGNFKSIKGVLLENKGLALAVHYRLVAPDKVPALKQIFDDNVRPYLGRNKFKVRTGKKVLELVPAVNWNKGKFVKWLMNTVLTNNAGTNAFYFGDDLTDEDAFKALGAKAYTVLVGKPRDSAARYYLLNSREVAAVLNKLAKTI